MKASGITEDTVVIDGRTGETGIVRQVEGNETTGGCDARVAFGDGSTEWIPLAVLSVARNQRWRP
jgi:hypothetical protein